MDQGEAGRPLDRRVARSRRAIMGAFEELMLERPLEKVTVSAIAQRADVDRKTFYQHFGTIDGLLSALAERFVQQIVDAMDEELDVRAGKGVRSRMGRKRSMLQGALRALMTGLARSPPSSLP